MVDYRKSKVHVKHNNRFKLRTELINDSNLVEFYNEIAIVDNSRPIDTMFGFAAGQTSFKTGEFRKGDIIFAHYGDQVSHEKISEKHNMRKNLDVLGKAIEAIMVRRY